MDGELGWPEVELAKKGVGGGDLSRLGLLRCRGGGPREAVEDEALPVGVDEGKHGRTWQCGTLKQRMKRGKGGWGRGSAQRAGK
jgi:hypothetical protein